MINDDVVAHEPKEPCSVDRRRHSRDSITFLEYGLLKEVFKLLVEVEILQVVNDANMVNVAATLAQELVAIALKPVSDLIHFISVHSRPSSGCEIRSIG